MDQEKFIDELHVTERLCQDRGREELVNFTAEKRQSRIDYVKDQKYLDELLATNSTKAASRLATVRRWT